MRKEFINTLFELAEKDKNIYLLVGDVGFGVFEDFAQKFPKRFINCGISEPNMMGVAAGLALSGKKVYVYSIIPFVTMRPFEQVRNDICYQNLDVKIVGVGSGFAYGYLGSTHHAIEDIAILRVLPNMTVLCPADPVETRELVLKSYETKNPTYIRLNRTGEKILYNTKPDIIIGKPSVLKEGKDGIIIATGISLEIGMDVVGKLKENGHDFKLISMHTLKPINEKALLDQVKGLKVVFTLEEHNIIGGLGSAVAEVLKESEYKGKFKRIAVPDEFPPEVGEAEYFRKKYRLAAEYVIDDILKQI